MGVVDEVMKGAAVASPIISGVNATVTSTYGNINWSNWAVTVALGVLAFFLKRLIAKLDTNTEKLRKYGTRLAVMETKHDGCCGGRRGYDPEDRTHEDRDGGE